MILILFFMGVKLGVPH